MNGCESWTLKNVECWRLGALNCHFGKDSWKSLDCKQIKPANPKWNQPWIFIGRTDAEAEAPIFCHLLWRTYSLEKTLMLGKIEGRRRGRQRMRWLYGITDLMDMSSSKLQDRESWHAAVHSLECKESDRTEQLNWTELKIMVCGPITSWQKEEKQVEALTDFLFLGSKITENGDCSHEIIRHLLLGKKAMKN